jgi:hypothetical protein
MTIEPDNKEIQNAFHKYQEMLKRGEYVVGIPLKSVCVIFQSLGFVKRQIICRNNFTIHF